MILDIRDVPHRTAVEPCVRAELHLGRVFGLVAWWRAKPERQCLSHGARPPPRTRGDRSHVHTLARREAKCLRVVPRVPAVLRIFFCQCDDAERRFHSWNFCRSKNLSGNTLLSAHRNDLIAKRILSRRKPAKSLRRTYHKYIAPQCARRHPTDSNKRRADCWPGARLSTSTNRGRKYCQSMLVI